MKTERSSARHPAFARVPQRDWQDWRWQLRHRIRDLEGLERVFTLTADERAVAAACGLTPEQYATGRATA